MSRGGFRALLAAVDAGFQPLGMAIGAVGYQTTQVWACGQGTVRRPTRLNPQYEPLVYEQYEEGIRTAWRTAIQRLEADATRLGAHGVVGVAVKREWTSTGLQLQITGSAVVAPGVQPLARPFLSTVSWQDTLKLLLGGWVPDGIAVGVSAVHVHAWAFSAYRANSTFSNTELPHATAGLMLARKRAHLSAASPLVGGGERMVAAAVELERTESHCAGGRGMLVEGLILGTAITRYREPIMRPAGARDLTGAGARG